MKKVNPVLHEKLQALISSMGYELVGCEAQPQAGQMVFRIFIDKPNGVTVDDCSQVSYQVSAMMDVEDPFAGRYALEVSSPGIDRPLFEIDHFRQFVGKRVRVKLYSPVNQRRQFKGIILRVDGEDIYLQADDFEEEIRLPFDVIEKANLMGDVRI